MRLILLSIVITLLPASYSSAQLLNLKQLKGNVTGNDYKTEKDCIGQMGVAKMQALEIKLQRSKNELEMKCTLRDRKAADYAKEQHRIIKGDASVFELEKCNQEMADTFRTAVDTLYQEGKPACPN